MSERAGRHLMETAEALRRSSAGDRLQAKELQTLADEAVARAEEQEGRATEYEVSARLLGFSAPNGAR